MTRFQSEHDIFRDSVRQFIEKEVLPVADTWEANGYIPRDMWKKMGELGFLGINLPSEYGGTEADFWYSVAFLEEVGRSGYGGFSASVAVQEYMAIAHLARAGSHELKQKFLAPAIAGEQIGALAISEPNIGSDVANLETSAVLEGDFYRLNGSKMFITNGGHADFVTVAARTGGKGAEGVSLLIVESQSEGFKANPLQKLGWHCSDTAELVFEDVLVPKSHLIGKENHGFYYIMESFQLERLVGAILAIGGMDRCLEMTRDYIASRKAFNRPIGSFQAIRHRFVDLLTEFEAARQLTYLACDQYAKGEMAVQACSMAKLYATELSNKVADVCLQLHGGYGYMNEYPISRFYRDSRVGTIAGGTSEIMREILAKTCLDQVRYDSKYQVGSDEQTADGPGVEEILLSLPQRFRSEKANGFAGVVQFHIQGSGGGEFTAHIQNSACSVEPGLKGEADCHLRTDAETYCAMELGQLAPEAAFMSGKVKVDNIPVLMQFTRLFSRFPT
ncbi:MAG: acyl-CoA dehydrogenase family protein [Acidobacteria bacterium]|nr:acyl-CoA dehydrogenase family protein [Acidobacteriota bacterium]MCB9398973.1 acyl-CoA dehydrogenase family protein [Acidobacteriota bacterium]